jgi:glycosyltransferase involved in cell wall biosynthesis
VRIAFVTTGLIYGGTETQLIALSRELVKRGNEVSIYTLTEKNPRLAELHGSGVSVVVDQKRLKLDPRVLWRLRSYIKRTGADVVQGLLHDGNVYAPLASIGTGALAFASERNDDYVLSRNQRIGLLVSRGAIAGVIANSHAGAEFARRNFRLPKERFHVVWNGIDIDAIRTRAQACKTDYRREFFHAEGVKVACLVGNVKPSKDYELALRVADTLTRANPEWRVLFIGGPAPNPAHAEYVERVSSIFRAGAFEGRAHFAGLRKDVFEIVSHCDVLFSTSRNEGFPNAVLEAMAVGTPVVTTDYSDIRRILPEQWQVVRSRTPEEITAAILRADCERSHLAESQRAWVEQNATIVRAAQRLEDVYRKAAAAIT